VAADASRHNRDTAHFESRAAACRPAGADWLADLHVLIRFETRGIPLVGNHGLSASFRTAVPTANCHERKTKRADNCGESSISPSMSERMK
jgi:hypothetical protein